MRISYTHKIIFVSNPKTGSHTGFKLMEENFNGRPLGGFHNVVVPTENLDYKTFTFVRDPYDRAVSIWNSVLNKEGSNLQVPKRDQRDFTKAIGSTDFKSFCLWIKDYPKVNHKHIACEPQFSHLRKCNVPLYYIKMENMLSGLNSFLSINNIPVLYSIPHELHRPHKSFWELGDQECLDAINIWADEDFNIFKYNKFERFNEVSYLQG